MVVCCIFAAMGIGADVANAFATSVGSKSLTIKSAIIIATIFECAGAILMGSHVTNTIRKGIADYKCFEENPEILMYGCMCVLFSVGLWLFIASYFEMPVSTTHSCVGGMIGMTLVIGGSSCVKWLNQRYISICWWSIWYSFILGNISSYVSIYIWFYIFYY